MKSLRTVAGDYPAYMPAGDLMLFCDVRKAHTGLLIFQDVVVHERFLLGAGCTHDAFYKVFAESSEF